MAVTPPTMTPQESPFDEQSSVFTQQQPLPPSKLRTVLPAAYHKRHPVTNRVSLERVVSSERHSVRGYLSDEVDVTRLNKIHQHLWFAGLPRPARPLHEQIGKGREIVITERADCHLVWEGDTILIKPLPAALMDHAMWTDYLCQDKQLYEAASGLLLSYIWLVCQQSDLKIAHEKRLLCEKIDWESWRKFVDSSLGVLSYSELEHINPRYLYGELRLNRLNIIYRCCWATTSLSTFIRGYNYSYTRYLTFFKRNTAWFLVVVVYITIVLTAMQVGLATEQLQDDQGFNRASYGFTVFSILAPMILWVGMSLVIFFLVMYNLVYTLKEDGDIGERYPNLVKRAQQFHH